MSTKGASPSGFSNGPTPTGATPSGTTPNGTAPRYVRRPQKADPLRPRNKKPIRRQISDFHSTTNTLNSTKVVPGKNGAINGMGRGGPTSSQLTPQPSSQVTYGGWTNPPQGDFQDFPLVTTVRELKDGMKHHILRFSSKKTIDPTNPSEFTRPVSLQRRNPQQLPNGKFKDEDTTVDDGLDDKEREKQEIAKLEKEEKRAAELALVAPSLSTGVVAKKNNSFNKNAKTNQVRHINLNAQDQKESNTRYEEAVPWHLEDAENSQTWMGIYEAALSETHVALVPKDSKFYMIPIEKWYKFTSKGHFKTMTTEEAEAAMNKKVKEPRWVMEHNAQFKEAREKASAARAVGLYTVKGESATFKNANKGETHDIDDLDYEDMDFQDDEEHVTVEKEQDEDEKDAGERVKRDQLKANLFGEADELAADKEAEAEEREAEMAKLMGRELQKALVKREKNYIYDSDSDVFSSSSDEESEEKKKLKEEKRRKEEEAKLKASKGASGASTKGTNTPQLGRPPKILNPDGKKGSLKRVGSPNLSASEASGTESARKKQKSNPSKNAAVLSSSQQGQAQRSPSMVKMSLPADKVNQRGAGASRPADEDVEMSDASAPRKKIAGGKIKLGLGGSGRVNGNSPAGSRAGSPLPGRDGSVGGSRAGSPNVANGPNKTPGILKRKTLDIEAEQIRAAIPAEGISSTDLLDLFKIKTHYVHEAQKEFIARVKNVSEIGPDRKLRPKALVS